MPPYLYRRLMREKLAQLRQGGDMRHMCGTYTSRAPTSDAAAVSGRARVWGALF